MTSEADTPDEIDEIVELEPHPFVIRVDEFPSNDVPPPRPAGRSPAGLYVISPSANLDYGRIRMAAASLKNDALRLQVELSPKDVEKLNWLMRVCDLSTKKELFNNSLTVLDWVVHEVMAGRKVGSFADGSRDRRILSMPALTAAAGHKEVYDEGDAPEDGKVPRRTGT